MTKTNNTRRVAALEDHRPLADSELDAVTGGRSNAVPKLYKAICKGTHLPEVTLENIMSKTNDNSYGAAAMSEQTRELTVNELDQIAGGTPSIPIPPPTHHAIGYIQVRFPPATIRS